MSLDVNYQKKAKNILAHNLWLRTVKSLNAILIMVPFAICWMEYYFHRISDPDFLQDTGLVILLFLILYALFGRIYNAFLISLVRISEIIYSQALAFVFSDGVMYIVIWLMTKRLPAVWPLLIVLGVQLIISIVWAFTVHRSYFRRYSATRTVVIWDMREGLEELIHQYGLAKRFEVIGTPNVWEVFKDPENYLYSADAVFLCGIHSHERNKIVKECVQRGIRVYVIPRVGDTIMSGAKPIHLFHLPMLMLERYNPPPEYLFLKRAFDIFVSLAALIILSPLMLVVAVSIRRDGGTAFYRQKRLTKDGKEFYVLKFRSMKMDAEKDGVARLSTGENDDRITPIGHFIRSCRIDELPQLINILKGEMTIVGPRPERPEIAAEYEKELPEFALRLQAKAGLTGYAQIYGKYNTTPYDKLLMDLQYIANPSIGEDLKLMFATVKILFMPESTEGVAVGATTAMDYENAADSTENDTETVAK